MEKVTNEKDELAQRVKELEAIAALSDAIANILDLEELLQTVLVWTTETFDLYLVNIALLDDSGENLIPFLRENGTINESGLDFSSDVPPIPVNAEPSLCARVARERKRIVVNDALNHPDFMPHPLLPQTRSELVLPMIVADELIGILDVQSTELDRFTEADVRMFITLTSQFGIAIQNVRAYQLSERRAAELTILNEMSRSLNTTGSIDALLMTFYRYASRLIDTTNFYVAFYEPEETEEGEIVFALDVEEGKVRHWYNRRHFSNRLTEYIIKTKQSLLVPSNITAVFPQLGVDNIRTRCKSWLGVPMIVSDVVTGVVCVQSYTTPNLYNEDSLRLLVSMTNQVSLAIENARLFAQVKEHSNQLEVEVARRTVELSQANDQLRTEITDRIEAEKVLQIYAKELERSNNELQNFAYVVSHDLQEPLRKITSFGSRIQERYADVLDERGQMYLERMSSAASRMQSLISDLLGLSRVTTHMEPFVPIDLRAILAGVLADLEVHIDETGGVVEAEGLPKIEADPTQMRQLLQNLIVNALKYMRTGVPPVVHIKGEVVLKEGREMCQIRVQDNGIGIEAHYLERIFEVFERVDVRREIEGTGVGLTICRKIVERHQGSIRVESVPNEGTTFIVLLPVRQGTGG
jgi:signal transduction histidine kinase